MSMLSTFCHISEYGTSAYRRLPALVAVSGSLTLWAPSSVLLGQSSIPDREFLALVEAGHIRVLARHAWLTDPASRDAAAKRWGPAAWVPNIDSALKRLLDDGCSNVIVAPPERGKQRAQELADTDPRGAQAIYDAYTTLDVPIGVRESVERNGTTPTAIVHGVMRDVVNHADAFSLSGARRPMFLSTNPQSQFIRQVVTVLDEAQGSLAPRQPDAAGEPVPDPDEQLLAEQLLDLISALDEARTVKRDLMGFMGGQGHKALSAWYERFLADVQEDGCTQLDGIVARHLERDIARHRSGGPHRAMGIRALSASAEIAGLATAIAGFAADPGGWLSIAGLGTAAIDSGLGQLERTGWIKPGYEGTQWPFFYLFGEAANAMRHEQARQVIGHLR